MGLQLRNKTPKRRVKAKLREDRSVAVAANETWAMDFVHDQLATGRKLRVLTIVDTFSRFSPVLDARFSYRGEDVVATLDRVCRFLGIAEGRIGTVPPDNSRPYVVPGRRAGVLGGAIRAGAYAGSFVRPEIWRRVSRPLVAALQQGGPERRPRLDPEQRTALLQSCTDDLDVLEEVLGQSFDDWRSHEGRGSFTERVAGRP